MLDDSTMMRLKPEHEPAPERALEVSVLGMTKRFGAFTALDDVSMRVAAGSFHALLGENGAGKSTLVKCLVGFHPPDAGQITVGTAMERRDRARRSSDRRTSLATSAWSPIRSCTSVKCW